ncbi:hypothetical protein M758_1G110900 [Ceratodon purpureus]|nr:hypothetical protein M758_1G110900 [Ceratodon purpureus]
MIGASGALPALQQRQTECILLTPSLITASSKHFDDLQYSFPAEHTPQRRRSADLQSARSLPPAPRLVSVSHVRGKSPKLTRYGTLRDVSGVNGKLASRGMQSPQ